MGYSHSPYKQRRRHNRHVQKQNIILEIRNETCGTNYQAKKYKKMCWCCYRLGNSCDMTRQGSRKKRTKERNQALSAKCQDVPI